MNGPTKPSRTAEQMPSTTRWDRITRQHQHAQSDAQTADIRRLCSLDFVNDRQQQRMSNGGGAVAGCADPALLMDMRHAVVRSTNSFQTGAAADGNVTRAIRQERLQEHHAKVEQLRNEHELRLFQSRLPQPPKKAATATTVMVVKLDNYQQPASLQPSPHTNGQDDIPNADCFEDDEVDRSDRPLGIFYHAADTYYENALNTIDPFDDADDCDESHLHPANVGALQAATCCVDSITGDDDDDEYSSGSNIPTTSNPLCLFGTHLDCSPVPAGVESVPNSRTPSPKVNEDGMTITKLELEFRCQPLATGNMRRPLRMPEPAAMSSESPEQHERSEIIAEVLHDGRPDHEQRRTLLQQHFRRWTHYVTVAKMAAHNRGNERCPKSRAHMIEQYLRAMRMDRKRPKAPMLVEDHQPAADKAKKPSEISGFAAGAMVKQFSNKLKAQNDIIELQRLKLERQQRLIAELQFTRLADETRDSQATCKQELRDVIRTGCARSKAAARCLQRVNNLRDAQDADEAAAAEEDARLQARGTPKFLQDMQARALERNARHREARERRERLEREKEEQRLAAEAAKLLQDEQAKQQRIEQLREKRRTERLQREQREQDRLRFLDNVHRADAFNRRRLLRRFGLDAFVALLRLKQRNLLKADAFRVFIRMRRSFAGWLAVVEDARAERERRAEQCARRQRLRNALASWIQYQAAQHSKLMVAIDWHDMRLAERTLRHWDGWTRHQLCVEAMRMRQAASHYAWHLKWRVLDSWRRLHQVLQLERETDERRQRWRVKIWELLPDYRPNADGDVGEARV